MTMPLFCRNSNRCWFRFGVLLRSLCCAISRGPTLPTASLHIMVALFAYGTIISVFFHSKHSSYVCHFCNKRSTYYIFWDSFWPCVPIAVKLLILCLHFLYLDVCQVQISIVGLLDIQWIYLVQNCRKSTPEGFPWLEPIVLRPLVFYHQRWVVIDINVGCSLHFSMYCKVV